MATESKHHSSSEFGKTGSSSISGLDAPMIGAAASIAVDAIVERESGVTPPPPPVSLRALIVGLVVVFLLGVVVLGVVAWLMPRVLPPDLRFEGVPAAVDQAPPAEPATGK
jgi:hypothetical protein